VGHGAMGRAEEVLAAHKATTAERSALRRRRRYVQGACHGDAQRRDRGGLPPPPVPRGPEPAAPLASPLEAAGRAPAAGHVPGPGDAGAARRAAALGQCRLLGLVVERVDEESRAGETPLVRAVAGGVVGPAGVAPLIEAGADVVRWGTGRRWGRRRTTGSGPRRRAARHPIAGAGPAYHIGPGSNRPGPARPSSGGGGSPGPMGRPHKLVAEAPSCSLGVGGGGGPLRDRTPLGSLAHEQAAITRTILLPIALLSCARLHTVAAPYCGLLRCARLHTVAAPLRTHCGRRALPSRPCPPAALLHAPPLLRRAFRSLCGPGGPHRVRPAPCLPRDCRWSRRGPWRRAPPRSASRGSG
jgi:hypothetical protein